MELAISLIIITISILISYVLIIDYIRKGKYKVKDDASILSKEAEDRYFKEFPEYTIQDLKLEIEKVADILINNESSNRYTEALRQKAKNDDKIKVLKDSVVDKVEIIKYVDGVLKARVKYRDNNHEYSLILSMNTVTTGRVFLNSYYIFKDKLTFARVS
ncbi:MAG: hypothetical protein HFJ45_04225 [Clostridia bacterium]|nr:hypothetical protein [Clostridia bacterium]